MSEVVAAPVWEARSLREVVTKLVDGSHNPPPKQETGLPMLSARNIDRGQVLFDDYRLISESAFVSENARTRIAPGDVLLTIVGTIGRTAVVPEGSPPFSLQRSVAVLTPSVNLLPKFLCYQLESPAIQKHFEANARGTAQKGVYLNTLGQTPVVLPPLDVQREIVAEIEKQFSRLDEAVANLQRVKANLKRYKASVLKAAVEGRLVETEASLAHREGRTYENGEQLLQRILAERLGKWVGKRKYREPVTPETEALSASPEGWVWASPEQVSAGEPYSLAIGPFGSSLKVSDYKTEGVPLVFVRNIRSGSFGGENTVYVTADKAVELSAHSVEAGDILVTKMGDPPGDVCRYPANRPLAVITADCIKLRVTKVGIDPAFIEYAMASRVVQDQILGITKGVAQLKVNLANFSSIALPLPPHAEQARIVAEVDRHLSIVREVEAEVDTNLQRAHALRQATLAKIFRQTKKWGED